MKEEKFNKVVNKILKKNGISSYLQNFSFDSLPNFSLDGKEILDRCSFKISNELTVYFISYNYLDIIQWINTAYFVKDGIIIDSFTSYEPSDFKKIYEAKEAYINYLLKDFLGE